MKIIFLIILIVLSNSIFAQDVGIPSVGVSQSIQALASNLRLKVVRVGQTKEKCKEFRFDFSKTPEENIKEYESLNKFLAIVYHPKDKVLFYWSKDFNPKVTPLLLETKLFFVNNELKIKSPIKNLNINLSRLDQIKHDSDSDPKKLAPFILDLFAKNPNFNICNISCSMAKDKIKSLKMISNNFKEDLKLSDKDIENLKAEQTHNDVNISFTKFHLLSFNQKEFNEILTNSDLMINNSSYYIKYYSSFYLEAFLNKLKEINFWGNYKKNKFSRSFSSLIISSLTKQKNSLSVEFLLRGITQLQGDDEKRLELIKLLPDKDAYNGKFQHRIKKLLDENRLNWLAYSSNHWNPQKAIWRGDNVIRKDRWGNFNIPSKKQISKKFVPEINSEVICFHFSKPFIIGGIPLLKFEPSDLETPEKAYISLFSARNYLWKKQIIYEHYPKTYYKPFFSWYNWNSELKKIVEINYFVKIIGNNKTFVIFPVRRFITQEQAKYWGYQKNIYESFAFLIYTKKGWKIMNTRNAQTEKIKKVALQQLKESLQQ